RKSRSETLCPSAPVSRNGPLMASADDGRSADGGPKPPSIQTTVRDAAASPAADTANAPLTRSVPNMRVGSNVADPGPSRHNREKKCANADERQHREPRLDGRNGAICRQARCIGHLARWKTQAIGQVVREARMTGLLAESDQQ